MYIFVSIKKREVTLKVYFEYSTVEVIKHKSIKKKTLNGFVNFVLNE